MNNVQLTREIIEEVRKLSIVEEIEKHMELPRKRSGDFLGLCPFHNDTRLGSFVVSEKRQRYSCFACDAGGADGKGGDLIDFRAKFLGIDYRDAALQIAVENGIINATTFKKLERKSGVTFDPREVRKTKKVEKNEANIPHNVAILNTVYSVYLELCTLSEEHRNYLKEKRFLNDETIGEIQYRTNGQRGRQFMEEFAENLKNREELKEMTIEEILGKTPGFFQRMNYGFWQWSTHYTEGILIPIRDELGQIEGLQIRRDEVKEGEPRYVWFSSAFAESGAKKYFKNGTGQSTPLNVIYPKQSPSKALFITEGHFKAKAIADRIGAVVISVQGVVNHKGIEELIRKTEEETKRRNPAFVGFENICIAFDSDFRTNDAVYKSLKNMSDDIAKKIKMPISYVQWDTKFKGIDDLLYSEEAKDRGFRKLMKVEKKEKYDSRILMRVSECVKL